jgi:hypothetical protein
MHNDQKYFYEWALKASKDELQDEADQLGRLLALHFQAGDVESAVFRVRKSFAARAELQSRQD